MAFAKANTGLFVIFRYGTYQTYPRLFFRYPLLVVGGDYRTRTCTGVRLDGLANRSDTITASLRVAEVEGLEPSGPCGLRFSGPLRYQLRFTLPYVVNSSQVGLCEGVYITL